MNLGYLNTTSGLAGKYNTTENYPHLVPKYERAQPNILKEIQCYLAMVLDTTQKMKANSFRNDLAKCNDKTAPEDHHADHVKTDRISLCPTFTSHLPIREYESLNSGLNRISKSSDQDINLRSAMSHHRPIYHKKA